MLARFAAGRPRTVIVLHLALLAVALGFGFRRLHQTDDLLQFLPADNPEIRTFRDVSRTFGSLRVAVLGVEAPANDDVFSPDVLRRIDEASKQLKEVRGVDNVVSLTTLPDFTPSGDAVPLVDAARAADPQARAAMKARSLAHRIARRNFVSRDGSAALVLVFLADGVSSRATAREIRATAAKAFGPLRAVYGGEPFAEASIFEETEQDIRLLTPVAALLIFGVILIAFRDPVGVALTVLTVAWATVVVLGFMGLLGEAYTVISGTLPVILFASGSSYAVHVLGRYYSDGGGAAGPDAPVRAAAIVGPPVTIAGLTTAAGFVSFLSMDIRPMRVFGLEAAIGVLLCWLASLTLVPAVITLWPRRSSRPINTGRLGDWLGRFTGFARRRRVAVLAAGVVLGAATVGPMLRVDVKMEASAFYSPGSDPWNAERFLDEKFGGSHFLQVDVKGDMTDPATLREIERLQAFAASLPGVTQAQSVVDPLALIGDVMVGEPRLPETRAQVASLLLFIDGPALRNVLAPKRDEALVHIRVRGDVQPALEAMEQYTRARFRAKPVAPTRDDVAERLRWIAQAAHQPLPPGAAEKAAAAAVPPAATALAEARRDIAAKLLDGDGGLLPRITDEAARARVLDAAAAAGDVRAALVAVAPSPEEGASAYQSFADQLAAAARARAATDALAALGATLPPEAADQARTALADLLPSTPVVAAERPLEVTLTGEPVLNRGFSRSIARNQQRSLVVALVVVYLLMLLLFRSGYLAAVSLLPSALWMAVVFGAMGLLHVSIDISTSLVASIATGAGSDFAMHYLWYFKRRSPEEAVRFVGPIMVISSLLVSAGFAVLSVGHSRPMRTFGTLAAVAMAGAFALTFLLVPALLRRSDLPPEKV